ncbi:MAG: conjugal transfer protein TrbI, partial [Hyphomicrobiales bacterium]|nr:conjugal transfer protein TrbI [Hyphomicrobiales bacterium]
KSGKQNERYQIKRKSKPDGLDKLPSSYDRIPKLGSPNSGDIGKSLARLESELGIKSQVANPIPSYRPDPEADFLRAERIRLARLKSQAQESGVFFTVSRKKTSDTISKTDAENTNRDYNNRRAELDALTALTNAGDIKPDTADTGSDLNGQKTKLAFLQKSPDAEIYNKHAQQIPVSPHQLVAGTIIPASLVTGLNSDLPGMVIAQVTENVFDTITGQHLLIPQGTRLIGKYDSVITFGQERALVIWQRIIRPDGTSVVIDNLPATDTGGYV